MAETQRRTDHQRDAHDRVPYGPVRRYLRKELNAATRYLGGVEWITRSSGGVALECRRSIGGFLILSEKGEGASASRECQCMFTGHLGSLDTRVNLQMGEKTKLSFDI